jgi:hypothetical protein
MVTYSSYLYSRHAVAAILEISSDLILSLQVWASVVWVRIRGRRPQFISKKAFVAAFVSRRRAAGKDLQKQVTPTGNDFVVNGHRVEACEAVGLRHMHCDCPDFANQLQLNPLGLRQPISCCKHCYATLGYLGYSSLSEFLVNK